MAATAPSPAASLVPLLRLPSPLLEYLLTLPGDQLKLVLRLLQRAHWAQAGRSGAARGRLRFSLSIDDLWKVLLLVRDTAEAEHVSTFRAVLNMVDVYRLANLVRLDTRLPPPPAKVIPLARYLRPASQYALPLKPERAHEGEEP